MCKTNKTHSNSIHRLPVSSLSHHCQPGPGQLAFVFWDCHIGPLIIVSLLSAVPPTVGVLSSLPRAQNPDLRKTKTKTWLRRMQWSALSPRTPLSPDGISCHRFTYYHLASAPRSAGALASAVCFSSARLSPQQRGLLDLGKLNTVPALLSRPSSASPTPVSLCFAPLILLCVSS